MIAIDESFPYDIWEEEKLIRIANARKRREEDEVRDVEGSIITCLLNMNANLFTVRKNTNFIKNTSSLWRSCSLFLLVMVYIVHGVCG